MTDLPAGAHPCATCPGPLIWYDVGDCDAILECAHCGYLIVAGSFHDEVHSASPLLREGAADHG
jgi:hypothetical protein